MTIFFCGIGGSGMMPLAFLQKARGAMVAASDRAFDQGKTPGKFAFISQHGIKMFAQDGSGLAADTAALIVSAAVEESIPDVGAARRFGVPIKRRAELLAEIANVAPRRVMVGGTSGKTTVTGMIGFILKEARLDPMVMNGGIFRNYATAENPYCSWLAGQGDIFVTETDESDGSIALFNPGVAVLNNVSLDHKSMDELRALFGDFISKAELAVLNFDSKEVRALASRAKKFTSYGFLEGAELRASELKPREDGISAMVTKGGEKIALNLQVLGRHNVSNALAALAAAEACGVPLAKGALILSRFLGIKRRLDVVGKNKGVTVIDDFAHNPDKIAATLQTLSTLPGRLLIMFQPHGYGPLRMMRKELAQTFAEGLRKDDLLFMPEPYYAGGTTDRSVGSKELVADLKNAGVNAEVFATRDEILPTIMSAAKPGDRIVVMGARDDTLSDFAASILKKL